MLILLGHIEIICATERIQPAERAAVERREAQAINQRHIGFCRGGDDALFETAHHFVDHGDHHAGDNLFIAEITLRLADFRQQAIDCGILFLLRLTFTVFFVAPEAEAIFLAETVSVEQRIDRSR